MAAAGDRRLSKSLRLRPGTVVIIALVAAPLIALALAPVRITITAGRLWMLGVALLTGAAALILFSLSAVAMVDRRARSISRSKQVEREVRLVAATAACVVATEAMLLALYRPAAAFAYAAVVIGYVAIWIPRATRRVDFRSDVVAACTPQAAFDLVSDPRNWPRYWPNLAVLSCPPPPLHVGALIEDQVTTDQMTVRATEIVTDFVPPRRFGTAVVGGRGHGFYELTAVAAGTEIAYVSEHTLRFPEACLGAGLERRFLRAKLARNRTASLERVKRLLEEQPATAV